MKILFFITGLSSGGAEKKLFYLLEYFVKNNFVVDLKVISLTGGMYESQIKNLGVEVEIFSSKKISIFNIIKYIFFFRKSVKDFNPDIVHSFLYLTNIISKFSLFFFKKNFKLITSYMSLTKKYPIYAFLEFFNFGKSDLLISNSYRGLEDLNIYNLFKVKKKVINNSFEPTLKPSNLKNKKIKIIITVARLSFEKDYKTNILAIKELSKKRNDFKVIYVGIGNLENNLKRLVKKYNLSGQISFLGERTDVLDLLNKSDCFFLPTLYESQSYVLTEAMVMKVPIVTTDLSENRELLKGAFFCKVGDFKSMALKIDDILNNKFKSEWINKNYFHVINNLACDKVITKYYKEYKRLLNR